MIDYKSNKVYVPPTQKDIIKNLHYFKEHEFNCKCGTCGLGVYNMDMHLLEVLDHVRHELKEPILINSAVRCKEHNTAVGGSKKSEHTPNYTHNKLCCAVDVHIYNSNYLYRILALLYKYKIARIGYNQENNFLHIGTSLDHVQKVFFKY